MGDKRLTYFIKFFFPELTCSLPLEDTTGLEQSRSSNSSVKAGGMLEIKCNVDDGEDTAGVTRTLHCAPDVDNPEKFALQGHIAQCPGL